MIDTEQPSQWAVDMLNDILSIWGPLGDNAAAFALQRAFAEREAELVGALNGIYIYANDTLSGRTDGPDDRKWQRDGIVEIRNRAREFATVQSAVDTRTALKSREAGHG